MEDKHMNMNAIKELKNLDKDDILAALGLQTKRTVTEMIVPVLGLFSAGLLVGVGVGLLVAPRSGRELREDLGKQVANVRDRAMSQVGAGDEATQQSH